MRRMPGQEGVVSVITISVLSQIYNHVGLAVFVFMTQRIFRRPKTLRKNRTEKPDLYVKAHCVCIIRNRMHNILIGIG